MEPISKIVYRLAHKGERIAEFERSPDSLHLMYGMVFDKDKVGRFTSAHQDGDVLYANYYLAEVMDIERKEV